MEPGSILLFLLGLALLVVGSEMLVRGASRLAAAMGISPLVVGLTVVAFGTSSPELAVSVKSALAGQPDFAIGNVVGSNILNVLFILGAAAIILPLTVSQQLIRLDVPIMIGVSFLLYYFASNGRISRGEGAVFFAGILLYTLLCISQSRKESASIKEEYEDEYEVPEKVRHQPGFIAVQAALVLVGLGLLLLGSNWLVNGAVIFARMLGVGELIIGLTIISLGTSAPEIATTIMASLRGERDIAVGNVIGSNLCNILLVLGLTGLVAPDGIGVSQAALAFDIPVMIAVSGACLPIFFIGGRISRWEGLLFLFYYAAYTAYLIMAARHHDALPLFNLIMALFILPLTLVTLMALAALTFHRGFRQNV